MRILFFDINSDKINQYQSVLKGTKNVYFYHGSLDDVMSKYSVDILVSPANSFGVMTGGIDRDIANKYPMVIDNVKNKINESNFVDSGGRKYIPVGKCEAVKLDNQKKVMIIAPTMFLPKNIVGTNNVYLAFNAILDKIEKLKYTNYDVVVACPCLGTGVGGLTGTESANQILKSFNIFRW